MKLSDPIFFERRCDASGGIAISADRWVGANDEENILRLYCVDGGPPENDALLDLDDFLELTGEIGKREADLESATALGELIFWIGSHSQSRNGKDRPDRHRLIATKLTAAADGSSVLETFGQPCKSLREKLVADPRLAKFNLATAATLPPKAPGGFNIESLCAERGGNRLWIGFRNPISPAGALLVPLENPRLVVESGAAPVFGEAVVLDLGGLGVRDMLIAGEGYLILAGDFPDRNDAGAKPSALFSWSGPGTKPRGLAVDFGDLNPEALIVFPDQRVLIVSDDGARENAAGKTCKELENEDERTFRAAWLQPA